MNGSPSVDDDSSTSNSGGESELWVDASERSDEGSTTSTVVVSDDDDDDETMARVRDEHGRFKRYVPSHLTDSAISGIPPSSMKQVFFTEIIAPRIVDSDDENSDFDDDDSEKESCGGDDDLVTCYGHWYDLKSSFAKDEYYVPWGNRKYVTRRSNDEIATSKPLFRGFDGDDRQSDACRFASWYETRGGYLPFRRTLRWLRRPTFNLNASMAMLADVPDDNILRNRSYPLMLVLTILIDKYNEECLSIREEENVIKGASSVPNFTLYPKIGRVWMMLRDDLFYRRLLPKIIDDMPHIVMAKDRSERIAPPPPPPPWYARVSTTHTMLTILLARLSNDMFRKSFARMDDVMLMSFERAMDRDYVLLATIFSLFVDRRVVAELCQRHRRCNTSRFQSDWGIWCMCLVRGIPYDGTVATSAGILPPPQIGDFFNKSLFERSLGCVIQQYGLSFALQWLRDFAMPDMRASIHAYFYTVVWRFLNIVKTESNRTLTTDYLWYAREVIRERRHIERQQRRDRRRANAC